MINYGGRDMKCYQVEALASKIRKAGTIATILMLFVYDIYGFIQYTMLKSYDDPHNLKPFLLIVIGLAVLSFLILILLEIKYLKHGLTFKKIFQFSLVSICVPIVLIGAMQITNISILPIILLGLILFSLRFLTSDYMIQAYKKRRNNNI